MASRGLCVLNAIARQTGHRWSQGVIFKRPFSHKYDSNNPETAYMEIPIPTYTVKPNEAVTEKRARLIYQSRKRGIKETDLLLSTFAHKYLNEMTEVELGEYDTLINVPSNDWDIYYWATGVEDVPEQFDGPVFQKLKAHTRNDEREGRFKQPDLPID